MGLPMGKRLLVAGHDLVVVPHRKPDAALTLAATGATVRKSPAELAGDREIVITSVPDMPQVQEILLASMA